MPLTALLVVDVQRGILGIPNLDRKKEIDQALDETVKRIARLIEKSRDASVPVIYVLMMAVPVTDWSRRLRGGRFGPRSHLKPGTWSSISTLATHSSRRL
jgi:nicotinamidase-related amidase